MLALVHLQGCRRLYIKSAVALDNSARNRWIATHVLPFEAEVRGWLRRHVHTLSPADTDDVIQESYARLWLADLGAIRNGRSYFYMVVKNLLLELSRRARIVPMERLGEIEALRIPTQEPGPEQQVTARQELERLVAIIDALPEQCQRAFRLQKFHGYSQREIAQAMSISEKTVEKHLATALVRILKAVTAADAHSVSESREIGQQDARQPRD